MTTPNLTQPVISGFIADSSTQLPQQYVQSPAPQYTITQPPPQGRYFTEDDVERIRQQEKDKMYSRLEKSEQQLNEFKATVESLAADKKARDDELAARQKQADEEAKKLKDEKLSVQELLERQRNDFQEQQARQQSDWETKLAIMQQEQKLLQLKAYIQKRVNEEVNATTIIPDLVEYIDGTSEEEVEASIQKAKDKTSAIVNAAMGSNPPTSIPMGTSPTGAPFSPLDNLSPANRELSPQEIANMPMSQYREYRLQRGINRAGSGQGLFS